ncbi:MAG: DNA recombination protein RmuC [Acidimicrobiia bacterium]
MTFAIALLTLLAGGIAGVALGYQRGRRQGEDIASARAATELDAARMTAEQARQAASEAVTAGLATMIESARQLQEQLIAQNREAAGNQNDTVRDLVKPVNEQLAGLQQTIERLDRERANQAGSLDQQLHNLLQTTQKLNDDTKMLSTALRDTRVRGSWGELQLRRVVELADMMRHCTFEEQVHLQGEDRALRPDLVIKLPESRVILVDSKVPLNSYLEAMNCDDPDLQQRLLEDHAKAVEQHVTTLKSKDYGSAHSGSLGFVIMFVPGDTFLTEAYRVRPSLMAESIERGVLLTTPTALIGLLKAIDAGWRQERLAEHAEEIRTQGRELLSRLGVFIEHLAKVGTNLGRATDSYNRAVNSLQTRLLPTARRFEEIGIRADRDLEKAATQTTAPVLTADDRLELAGSTISDSVDGEGDGDGDGDEDRLDP